MTTTAAGVRRPARTQRWQIRGEVGSQPVKAPGDQRGGGIALRGELARWQRGDGAQHLAGQVGDHRRRAPLRQSALQPVRKRADDPQRHQNPQRGGPVCDRAGSRVGDDARHDVRQHHGRRDRGGADDDTAGHRCGEEAPHRRRTSQQVQLDRLDSPMDAGIASAVIRRRNTQ